MPNQLRPVGSSQRRCHRSQKGHPSQGSAGRDCPEHCYGLRLESCSGKHRCSRRPRGRHQEHGSDRGHLSLRQIPLMGIPEDKDEEPTLSRAGYLMGRRYDSSCPKPVNAGRIRDTKPAPLLLLVVLFAGLSIVSSGRGQSSGKALAPSDSEIPTPQRVREPAGASRCQFCHASEVEGYARSAMAHSLRRAGQEPDGTVGLLAATAKRWRPNQLPHRLRDRLRQSRLWLPARLSGSSVPIARRLL